MSVCQSICRLVWQSVCALILSAGITVSVCQSVRRLACQSCCALIVSVGITRPTAAAAATLDVY